MLSLSVCILIHVYVYFGAFVYEFVWIHVFEPIHACVFLFWGSYCFFLFYSEGAGDMKVCRCSDRERKRQCKSTESSGENSGGAQKQQQAEGKEDDSAF